MKTQLRILAVIIFLITVLTISAQVSQVQYEVIYNPASCLYEAHALVIGASLVYPSTIPYPSKFSVVAPSSISNIPFSVVQSVNPPGLSWSQSNNIYAPTAAPNSDFHAFTISGGGGPNAYPVFTVGTDILLFTFSIPHVGCEEGIRCYINGTDPNSAQPGMGGIDFKQAFKTANVNRYLSNTGSPVSLPRPTASSANAFSCNGNTLYLTSTGSTTLGCNTSLSYNWAGSGNFTSTAQNPVVSPYTAPGTYTVTIKDHNGCTNTSSIILTAPFQVLSALASATPDCNGASSGTVTVTGSAGIPGYNYLWNNGQTTATVTGLAAASYTVIVTDANACTVTAGATVTECVNVNISGYVLYANNPEGGMNGVTVRLRNSSNVIVDTTVTISNPVNSQPGYYAFSNIPDGTGYTLSGSFTGIWGGNNATDALIVQMNVVGQYPLSGLNDVVADVNASSVISALDALYIKMRTVGSISVYPAGDWKISVDTVSLSGTPVTQDLTALCVGDVTGNLPPTFKETTSMSVIEDGTMSVPTGETFVYNIRSSRNADLGAMTLFLGYDQERFEVTGIAGSPEGVQYSIGGGRIAIAWADTKPMNLNTDDLVLSLNMRVKETISEPLRVFTIMPGSEFADNQASPYENFDLKMTNLMTSGGTQDITMSNYPNPFVYTTTIVYTLPETGHAKLVLTDLNGKIIRTLVDREEQAGSHSVMVDPAGLNMNPGVYLYKIFFGSATDSYIKVNKMVLTR